MCLRGVRVKASLSLVLSKQTKSHMKCGEVLAKGTSLSDLEGACGGNNGFNSAFWHRPL